MKMIIFEEISKIENKKKSDAAEFSGAGGNEKPVSYFTWPKIHYIATN